MRCSPQLIKAARQPACCFSYVKLIAHLLTPSCVLPFCCCIAAAAALLLLQLINRAPAATPARVHGGIGVVVVLLAIIMNEGAVDSLQNGLAASISSHFLKNLPLKWTR
jgi:hypothetical protein